MKKIFLALIFIASISNLKAQYGSLNAILERLEETRGINQQLENVSIEDKKFYIVKDFEDYTERNFIVIKGDKSTYVEILDDKKTGESTSKVYSGDALRTRKNVISIRCDMLEGKKIPIPITKTLAMMKQKDILYLLDANSKDRWIDEASLRKK